MSLCIKLGNSYIIVSPIEKIQNISHIAYLVLHITYYVLHITYILCITYLLLNSNAGVDSKDSQFLSATNVSVQLYLTVFHWALQW